MRYAGPVATFTRLLAWGLHKLMSLPIRLCDLTSDELAGRDAMDGLFEKYAQSPREVSRRATVEDLVRLLGTRAFDELD